MARGVHNAEITSRQPAWLHHKTDTKTDESRMMHEPVDLTELIRNPAARRLWLLYSALGSLPLERAIELARAAEMFVAAGPTNSAAAEATNDAMQALVDAAGPIITETRLDAPSTTASVEARPATARNGLTLSEDQRDRLLTRLAEEAKNAELAIEFGLSAKQVQGIRMGCAREIARRRAQSGNNVAQPDQEPGPIALIDDIVRYLRQQDDVVVPQEDWYLVNGRFRMTAGDLVARANRIRTRQRKPPFEFTNGCGFSGAPSPKGHPLFWERPKPTEPVLANGSHEPH